MKTNRYLFLLSAIFSIFFLYLFWNEGLGINWVIYTCSIVAVVCYVNQNKCKSLEFWGLLSCFLITSFNLLVIHSDLAITMQMISFLILISFLQFNSFHTLLYLLFFKAIQIVIFALEIYSDLSNYAKTNDSTNNSFFNKMKIVLIPFLILLLFIGLYSAGDVHFSKILDTIFYNISFSHIAFMFLGFVVTLYLLHQYEFGNTENNEKNTLERRRKNGKGKQRNMYELINEYKMGLLTLGTLNLLIFVVNILEIQHYWIDFVVPQGFSLKDFVHQGTYALIFSILLSMFIVLHFFRKNLNFLSKNRWLKYLAVIWMVQNAIMVISVAVKNYHYISYHGLADKRIGEYVFLLMTLVGIVTLIIKVQKRKTEFWTIRANAWSVLIIMVIYSSFNWSVITTVHNLYHRNISQIDTDNYIEMSPRALLLAKQNLMKIRIQIEAHQKNKEKWINHLEYNDYLSYLNDRIEFFVKDYKQKTGLSWNYDDAFTYSELHKNKWIP